MNPKSNTAQSYILSIRTPLEEFFRRQRLDPRIDQIDWYTIDRMIEHTWYALIYPNTTFSGLMNLACRLKDREHPYAMSVLNFGHWVKNELEQFDLFADDVYVSTYHYAGMHGRWAIRIKRGFEDHLRLTVY
jgi:hypothetical protein